MYSNAVKIGGLGDYLSPSEECVLPLLKKDGKYEVDLNRDPASQRRAKPSESGPDGDIYSVNRLKVASVGADKRVTVGLSDCLSCSGCLTSSEEILLRDDNYREVLARIRESRLCVVSVSPQTVFMLSSHHGVPPSRALRRLSWLFKSLGAQLVFDIGLAELVALQKSKEEFVKARSSRLLARSNGRRAGGAHPEPGVEGCDEGGFDRGGAYSPGRLSDSSNPESLPIISSHCPGWTLYAEKTLDQQHVDLISRVPSSHIIQGLLVKTLTRTIEHCRSTYYLNYFKLFSPFSFVAALGGSTCTIPNVTYAPASASHHKVPGAYHVCLVPCYDKKLEMVRPEFQLDLSSLFSPGGGGSAPEGALGADANPPGERLVDDILSTGDVQKILDDLGLDFRGLKERDPDYLLDYAYYFNKLSRLLGPGAPTLSPNGPDGSLGDLRRPLRAAQLYSQSGGFSEEIFRHACQAVFGKRVPNVTFKHSLNEDFKESVLLDEEGNVLLRFLIAYGFKNVQNVIKLLRKAGKGGCTYDYVELMSCPGGCFNGAGQAIQGGDRRGSERSPPSFLSGLLHDLLSGNYFSCSKSRQRTGAEVSSEAFQAFLGSTEYVSTEAPACKYFSSLLELLRAKADFNLKLSSHKSVNVHW